MKRMNVVVSLLVLMLSGFAFAQTQDQNQDKDTAAMKRQNDQFRQQQANRPAADRDYRQTKEYKAQSPTEQKKTDAAVQRANQGLNTLRSGGGTATAGAAEDLSRRSSGVATVPASRPSTQPSSQPVRDPFARPSVSPAGSSSGSGSSKSSSTTSSTTKK